MTKEQKTANLAKGKKSVKRPVEPMHQGPLAEHEEPDLLALQRAVANPALASPADILALQRTVGNQDVQRLLAQRQGGDGSFDVDDETAGRINRARGGGQPLDNSPQEQMGAHLSYDFSGVRVHTGPEADELNQQLSARAFTTGRDIFFRQGEYSPGSSNGRELIAHELTHVVRQGTGRVSGSGGGMTIRSARDDYEQGAEAKRKKATYPGQGDDLDGDVVIMARAIQTALSAMQQTVGNKADGMTLKAAINPSMGKVVQRDHAFPSNSVFSKAHLYAFHPRDRTVLYVKDSAAPPVPPGAFREKATNFIGYKRAYSGEATQAKLLAENLKNDCHAYADELQAVVGKHIEFRGERTTPEVPPEVQLSVFYKLADEQASPAPGETYLWSTDAKYWKANIDLERVNRKDNPLVPDPMRVGEHVRKDATPYHFSTVVAVDDDDIITSEVNSAFAAPAGRKPWFTKYDGKGQFYKAFKAEYALVNKKTKKVYPGTVHKARLIEVR